MSWLGKILGGAIGFALGGPIGALAGVALGHNFDRPATAGREDGRAEPDLLEPRERTQTAFFTATFSVMGHLAKADGQVTRDEIRLAAQVMDEMRLTGAPRRIAERLFREGKADDFPIDEVLDQLRRECRYGAHLVTMFVEILLHAAFADGELHARERALLERICVRLHLPAGELERLEAMMRAQRHVRGSPAPDALSTADACAILGVEETCTDAELKKAYRRMMNRHHPDKLVAKGLPEEMMRVATEKTREIRTAYERLRRARGS